MYPYLGITGLMTRDEVMKTIGFHILDSSIRMPDPYKLMIGVLVSKKTLNGEPASQPGRYPTLDLVPELFMDDDSVINMVHYNSRSENFADELERMVGKNWDAFQGFQLNMVWPNPDEIEKFRKNNTHLLVLQIGPHAYRQVSGNPVLLADKLEYEYRDLVDYVLFDPSGGTGKDIDIGECDVYLNEVHYRGLQNHYRFGIAGGLCAETLPNIQPLLNKYPQLSIDAESKVRDEGTDQLNLDKTREYIKAAKRCLAVAAK